VLEPVLSGRLTSFEVTEDAHDNYNADIQKRSDKGVHVQCVSWYRNQGNGKVSTIFPGPGVLMWWRLRSVNWDHYKITPAAEQEKYLSKSTMQWQLFCVAMITPMILLLRFANISALEQWLL
jgi:hypothetical protein